MFCCALAAAEQGHSPDCEFSAPRGTCVNHRIIAHDAEGLERWCDFCGRDANDVKVRRGSGTWT